MSDPVYFSETRFRRRKPARTHLFVMALLIAGCLAVAIWPRDVPLSPRTSAAGLGRLILGSETAVDGTRNPR